MLPPEFCLSLNHQLTFQRIYSATVFFYLPIITRMRWVLLFSFPFTEGKLRFKEFEYPTQDHTAKKCWHQGWTRPVHSVCPMPSPCPQPWKENIVPLLTCPVVLSPSSTCHNPSQELCRSITLVLFTTQGSPLDSLAPHLQNTSYSRSFCRLAIHICFN